MKVDIVHFDDCFLVFNDGKDADRWKRSPNILNIEEPGWGSPQIRGIELAAPS